MTDRHSGSIGALRTTPDHVRCARARYCGGPTSAGSRAASWIGWDGAAKGNIDVGGGYYHPRGLFVGPDGTIVIADTGNQRLVSRSPDGQLKLTVLPSIPAWKAG